SPAAYRQPADLTPARSVPHTVVNERGERGLPDPEVLAGPVGDDEERNVPRVNAGPVPGRLVGTPPRDDRGVRRGHLVHVRLVLAGDLALARGFIAPRPAEHPVVQALAAYAQAAARAVVRSGDVPVHRRGDPGHDL